jgi:hypothetical protein
MVRAQRVVDFIEQFLVVPEGKDVGKPVRLRDWQREFIDKVHGTPTRREIAQAEPVPQAPQHHDGDDVGWVVGPVQRGAGALVGLLAAGPAGNGGSPAPSALGACRSAPGGGRPAAERAGDPGLARGRRDRVAPAGGRGLAEPTGRLATVAGRVRLVPALAGVGPDRRLAARGGAPPAQGLQTAGTDLGHHRHAGHEVHRGPRPARIRRGQGRGRAQAGSSGGRGWERAGGGRGPGLGAGPGHAGGAGREQGPLALPAPGRLRRRVRGRAGARGRIGTGCATVSSRAIRRPKASSCSCSAG